MKDCLRFNVSAVLFDLDGTLLETIEGLTMAANGMLADFGRPSRTVDEIRVFLGQGVLDLVEKCLDGGAEPATQEQVKQGVARFNVHYTESCAKNCTVYPGVVEALNALAEKNVKLACVTNKATAFTGLLLERMGLAHYFPVIVCGDTLATKKPDPAMLLHACKQLGVPPSQALMIGDSANDAQAAHAAEIPVLLLPYGYTEGKAVDTIKCDGIISTALDILDRIAVV